MNPRTKTLILFVAALGSSSFACTHLDIDTTDGFAQLDDDPRARRRTGYTYRATNAEGVVLAVRRERNAPRGDLRFWSGAVDAHLRRAGYQAASAIELESQDGVSGRQIRYTVDRGGRPHVFWATVFVTPEAVVTVEVGGDAEWFERQVEAVEVAIESVELS
jgi:hypothetical protein